MFTTCSFNEFVKFTQVRVVILLSLHIHPDLSAEMEETFQAYSSFTTDYLPPANYEKLLVSASKMRGQSVRNWEWREPQESKLVRLFSFFYLDGSVSCQPSFLGEVWTLSAGFP